MKKFLSVAVATLVLSIGANATEFNIDKSHSQVGFNIKHMVVSTTKGYFKNYSGKIDFDVNSKTFKVLNADIKTSSIFTDNQRRDEHLQSKDFFNSKDFPQIKFNMTSYDAKNGKMVGDLTIKDVTRQITLETTYNGSVKDPKGKTRIGFELAGKISRKDFGLTWNQVLETGGLAVGDDVKLDIAIEGIEK